MCSTKNGRAKGLKTYAKEWLQVWPIDSKQEEDRAGRPKLDKGQ